MTLNDTGLAEPQERTAEELLDHLDLLERELKAWKIECRKKVVEELEEELWWKQEHFPYTAFAVIMFCAGFGVCLILQYVNFLNI